MTQMKLIGEVGIGILMFENNIGLFHLKCYNGIKVPTVYTISIMNQFIFICLIFAITLMN